MPGVAFDDIVLDQGIQVAPWHDFHHQQGLLGLDAGTQEGNDVGVAARLQDHYLLDELLLLGRGRAAHHLDGNVGGTIKQPQVNRARPSCTLPPFKQTSSRVVYVCVRIKAVMQEVLNGRTC